MHTDLSYPDNNPKTSVGATKVPLHLVPPSATHYLAEAFENGAGKYGPFNWREHEISVTVYYAALKRHVDAFYDGEDFAEDSGVHHIAHAMACCAMLLDAASIGKLNDDRPFKGAAAKLQKDYADKRLPPTKKEPPIDRPLPPLDLLKRFEDIQRAINREFNSVGITRT